MTPVIVVDHVAGGVILHDDSDKIDELVYFAMTIDEATRLGKALVKIGEAHSEMRAERAN